MRGGVVSRRDPGGGAATIGIWRGRRGSDKGADLAGFSGGTGPAWVTTVKGRGTGKGCDTGGHKIQGLATELG